MFVDSKVKVIVRFLSLMNIARDFNKRVNNFDFQELPEAPCFFGSTDLSARLRQPRFFAKEYK